MRNLYEEILEILQENGKNESDIRWVGNKAEYFEPFDWLRLREIFDINSDRIRVGLLVVGDDWWLERECNEYCEEWWEFRTIPMKPAVGTHNASIISYK